MKLKKGLVVYASFSKDCINLQATSDNIILFLQHQKTYQYHQIIPILDFLDKYSALDNILLKTLDSVDNAFFRMSQMYVLKNSWNSLRLFSDTVQFIRIWLKKDPTQLLKKLFANQLLPYFYGIKYDNDSDQWYFPDLLNGFIPLVNKNKVTPSQVVDILFANFGFSDASMAEQFIVSVIGYNQLKKRISEVSPKFRKPLMKKVSEIDKQGVEIGLESRLFLEQQNTSSLLFRKKQTACPSEQNFFEKDAQRLLIR